MKQKTELYDLDDACLVNVFRRLTPLPHLFNVSAVCKRFKDLSTDGRLWLRVSGTGLSQEALSAYKGLVHDTLQEAVAASRPGDTIMLEPGGQHLARDITVTWPLRLLGGGSIAEETVIMCPPGADSVLDFRASGKVGNITMYAHMAACLIHRRGTLQVAGCTLHCEAAPGLEHLSAPLVTLASSPPRASSNTSAGSHQKISYASMQKAEDTAKAGDRRQGTAAKLRGSAGVLSVVETKIRGSSGSRAVRAGGTGILAGVRVINLSRDTLFWFTVDSAEPGLSGSSLPAWASQPPGQNIPSGAQPLSDKSAGMPAWAATGQALFPELSSTSRSSQGPSREGKGVVDLDLKSKVWKRLHCVTLDIPERACSAEDAPMAKRVRS